VGSPAQQAIQVIDGEAAGNPRAESQGLGDRIDLAAIEQQVHGNRVDEIDVIARG